MYLLGMPLQYCPPLYSNKDIYRTVIAARHRVGELSYSVS